MRDLEDDKNARELIQLAKILFFVVIPFIVLATITLIYIYSH